MKNRVAYRNLTVLVCLFFTTTLAPSLTGQSADKVASLYEKFSWRGIGPAVMGGRTVDLDAVESQPWIIYAAVGPSGVWKTENNGVSWSPVFYKENTVSVGDIAIAQAQPNIVWVGTGEATCRNSVTVGDGVYKSTDGGKTWTNMGLRETRHISRIIVNRGDPNIVYVAAMGHLWGPNPERGIFKTIDGGKTWTKVLYVNENTGFADLAMDPSDSLTLFAAAYEHRRLPYYFSSGGFGSGLYKTSDGGLTWKKLTKDLPEGLMGRIGIDVARSSPNVVYALIEHQQAGIWRSEDRGESWKRMCDPQTAQRVNNRPFYYSQIRVDPTDDKLVYVLSTGLYVSTDMGQKFRPIGGGIHPDHHAFWIDPANPLHLIDGNDGGIDVSYDGGKNWFAHQNMDLAEVYQIGYDMRSPYTVYCGLQDNGVWGGPSATFDTRGITNDDWIAVGGGDGFFAQVDSGDPNTIYANSQMNGIYRYDLKIRKSKTIKPLASLKEPVYRFNWNAPISISPFDPKTVYCGGNFLFKTTDGGSSWAIISPDLTTNDPAKQKDSGGPITPDNSGAEIHCTITSISESPAEADVIWCGTDDGNLQVTRDGGKTWKNVIKSIPGLPPNTWCSRIETSHFEAGTAYAAFDGHRMDDYAPYLYKTSDFGKTWKPIKAGLPPFGWIQVVREDPKNRNLLLAGTEFGVFASLSGGESWFSIKNNLPTVAVHDIAVHPREHDLIIGTHGRGIWILDDISYLEEMSEPTLASDGHLFNIHPATLFLMSSSSESYSKPVFAAKNPSYGLNITAYLRSEPKEKPKASIKDPVGKVIYEIEFSKKAGLQREVWNLQYVPQNREGKKITPTGIGFFAMPFVPPAQYTIDFKDGEKVLTGQAVVNPDPRYQIPETDRLAQLQALVSVLELSKKMGLSITVAKNIRRQMDELQPQIDKIEAKDDPLKTAFIGLSVKLQALEKDIIPEDFASLRSREQALRGGSLSQQILFLGMSISSYPSAPTQTDLSLLAQLRETTDPLVDKLNDLVRADLPRLNSLLADRKLKTIAIPNEVTL